MIAWPSAPVQYQMRLEKDRYDQIRPRFRRPHRCEVKSDILIRPNRRLAVAASIRLAAKDNRQVNGPQECSLAAPGHIHLAVADVDLQAGEVRPKLGDSKYSPSLLWVKRFNTSPLFLHPYPTTREI
jgi:hypothetical protein